VELTVYLSGEIHTEWRREIMAGIDERNLPVTVLCPVTDHAASDGVGAEILGEENSPFWRDHKGAKINTIRTRKLIETADVVVVKFGEKFRQWNAAFDAGYASALGKSLITLHGPQLAHALKEVDAAALAVTETPKQVVSVLEYVTRGS
jgi:YtoQ family protein